MDASLRAEESDNFYKMLLFAGEVSMDKE